MQKGIIITSSEATYLFLIDLLGSLQGVEYEVGVVFNNDKDGKLAKQLEENELWKGIKNRFVVNTDWNGFELAGILVGASQYDQFVYLPDTTLVKNLKFFDLLFEEAGGVYLCNNFFSYIGKYVSSVCRRVGIPQIDTKQEAVFYERDFNRRYLNIDKQAKQFIQPLPIETAEFMQKHGRKNMVLENDYIVKFKGTWSPSMIK